MKRIRKKTKFLLIRFPVFFIFLFCIHCSSAQDSINTVKLLTDSFRLEVFEKLHPVWMSMYTNCEIERTPDKEDSLFYKKKKKLITAEISKRNEQEYYLMAQTMWELGHFHEAEQMLLKLYKRNAPLCAKEKLDVCKGYYMGVGSHTSYVNCICQDLAKVYIGQEKFETALSYITLAESEYSFQHFCGNAYMQHECEVNALYAHCYEGLSQYDSIVALFLSDYEHVNSPFLARALPHVYSSLEIKEQLQVAENSITCDVDTFQTMATTVYNWGDANETTEEYFYTTGTASILLFGRRLTMGRPSLRKNEVVTREYFVDAFKTSALYYNLMR